MQYRTGKVFVTNGSAVVFGNVDTDWTSIVAGNWFALQRSSLTLNVQSVVLRAPAYFAAYAGGTTYAKCARISYGGKIYASLYDGNVGYQPDTNPLWWAECSGWELTLVSAWTGSTNVNVNYGIVKDFTALYGLPLPAAGDVEIAAILSRAFNQIEVLLDSAGLEADTRRGVSVVTDESLGDAYGLEQVSAAQTGDNKALRLFTSSQDSAYLAFGKYTSETLFDEFGRFTNGGVLQLKRDTLELGATFRTTLTNTATAARTISLPNATGTLALVASTVPSIAGTTNQIHVNGGTAAVAGSAVTISIPDSPVFTTPVLNGGSWTGVLSTGSGTLRISNGRQFNFSGSSTALTLNDATAGNNPLVITGGALSAGVVTFAYSTASTATTNGAVVIAGGLGVQGRINAGTFGPINLAQASVGATQLRWQDETAASRFEATMSSTTLNFYNYGTASNVLSFTTAGAISLVAGGTNQNITVTPSGTGSVTLNQANGGLNITATAGDASVKISSPTGGTWDWRIDNATGNHRLLRVGGDYVLTVFPTTRNLLIGNSTTDYSTEGRLQVAGRISAVGAGASRGNGVATGGDPAFYVSTAAASTADLFGFGSGSRLGLMRGYQDGGNTVRWQLGLVSGGSFIEQARLNGTGLADTVFAIYGTTASAAPTSGALTVAGGAGIAGSLWVGGQFNMTGSQTIYGQLNSTATDARLEFMANSIRAGLVGWNSTSFQFQSDGGRIISLVGATSVTGNLYPNNDAGRDLGIAGTNRWRDLHLSRTLLIGGATSSSYGIDAIAPDYLLGANNSGGGRADATTKRGRIAVPHYTNAEEPTLTIWAENGAAANTLYYGGGSSVYNTVTSHNFYAAANATTVTGTSVMDLNSTRLNISLNTPATATTNGALVVVGGIGAGGNIYSTGFYLSSGANIAGSAGAITVNAVGTNQSITLSPSGAAATFLSRAAAAGMVLSNSAVANGAGYTPLFGVSTIVHQLSVANQSTAPASQPYAAIGFFVQRDTNTYDTSFASIVGGKESATVPHSAGYLDFYTAKADTTGARALRINSAQNVLFGTITDSSNGRIQLATHTTIAGGIGFGTDLSLCRIAANQFAFNSSGTSVQLNLWENTVRKGFIETQSGVMNLGTVTAANVVFYTNSVAALTLDSSQNASFAGNVLAGGARVLGWSSRSVMRSTADGLITLLNSGETDFSRLQFGGTSSSFPALKRSGAGIHLRVADDTAFADLTANGLTLNAGVLYKLTASVATSITLTSSDHVVTLNNASPVTVNLPAAASHSGREYKIKNIGAGAVTVDANGAELIDDAATFAISQYQSFTFISNGTGWLVF